jgi:hypothetical protein
MTERPVALPPASWSPIVPIKPFLHSQHFDPELTKAMSAAFTQACAALGVSSRADPAAEVVARHIVAAARRGMRMKTALYFNALREIKAARH